MGEGSDALEGGFIGGILDHEDGIDFGGDGPGRIGGELGPVVDPGGFGDIPGLEERLGDAVAAGSAEGGEDDAGVAWMPEGGADEAEDQFGAGEFEAGEAAGDVDATLDEGDVHGPGLEELDGFAGSGDWHGTDADPGIFLEVVLNEDGIAVRKGEGEVGNVEELEVEEGEEGEQESGEEVGGETVKGPGPAHGRGDLTGPFGGLDDPFRGVQEVWIGIEFGADAVGDMACPFDDLVDLEAAAGGSGRLHGDGWPVEPDGPLAGVGLQQDRAGARGVIAAGFEADDVLGREEEWAAEA